MKLIIGLVILSMGSLIFLGSCNGCGKRGNGNVVTQSRAVSPFSKIAIEGVFPVELSQDGNAEAVKVEADDNLQDYVVVRNSGDQLIVKLKDEASMHSARKMKVYINLKKLNELEFKSVGSLTTANQLKLDSLELNSESVGKLDMDIDADFLHADLNSVGATTLKGKVREARINNKSIGSLSAYDLKAGTLMIHNTAVGTVEIYADTAFYIRSSAVGTLYYKGPGVVKELSSEGIGKVKKAE
jgi:hypothetical protein